MKRLWQRVMLALGVYASTRTKAYGVPLCARASNAGIPLEIIGVRAYHREDGYLDDGRPFFILLTPNGNIDIRPVSPVDPYSNADVYEVVNEDQLRSGYVPKLQPYSTEHSDASSRVMAAGCFSEDYLRARGFFPPELDARRFRGPYHDD